MKKAASKKKLDWHEQLDELAKLKIKIYAIQCGTNSQSNTFYKKLADKTSGVHLRLNEFSQINEMFMGLIYREGAEYQLEARAEEITTFSNNTNTTEGQLVVEDGDGPRMILPEDTLRAEMFFTDEDLKDIHKAIHSEKEKVDINGKTYNVSVGRAGCRFVTIDDFTFVEQNKKTDSKYAKMAIEGKAVTWIVNHGKWGLIIDNEISSTI